VAQRPSRGTTQKHEPEKIQVASLPTPPEQQTTLRACGESRYPSTRKTEREMNDPNADDDDVEFAGVNGVEVSRCTR
jgi:hypothetical protein